MRINFIFCVAFMFAQSIIAQNCSIRGLGTAMQWRFHSQQGEVCVYLTELTNPIDSIKKISLSYDASETISPPTIHEDTEYLGTILQEMQTNGYDPTKLEVITMAIGDSELSNGINKMLIKSGKWRNCGGLKYCHEVKMEIEQYLKSQNAFKEFDSVLLGYGLLQKAVFAYDVTVGQLPELKRNEKRQIATSNQDLCSGMLEIVIEKTAGGPGAGRSKPNH